MCSETWEHEKALQAWRAAVSQHPTSVRLWRRFLAFTTTGSFADFTIAHLSQAYTDALSTLSRAAVSAAATASDSRHGGQGQGGGQEPGLEGLELTHLLLLVDYAHALQRAGYSERSVGLLQAAVELNCFAPLQVRTLDDRLLRSAPPGNTRPPVSCVCMPACLQPNTALTSSIHSTALPCNCCVPMSVCVCLPTTLR
jgi:hypothetical protein